MKDAGLLLVCRGYICKHAVEWAGIVVVSIRVRNDIRVWVDVTTIGDDNGANCDTGAPLSEL